MSNIIMELEKTLKNTEFVKEFTLDEIIIKIFKNEWSTDINIVIIIPFNKRIDDFNKIFLAKSGWIKGYYKAFMINIYGGEKFGGIFDDISKMKKFLNNKLQKTSNINFEYIWKIIQRIFSN